jgi:hypothetical protein
MEHWLILIRAAGDLIYLIAALITLAAVLTDWANRRDNESDQN